MMGIGEIRRANKSPSAHAKEQMTDGQRRRNDSEPNNYWSDEGGPISYTNAHILNGESMDSMAKKGLPRPSLPSIYFDAVKMAIALEANAAEQSRNAQIIRGYNQIINTAKNDTELQAACASLNQVIASILDGADGERIKMHMLVNDLANTIEATAPLSPGRSTPLGYTPRMGLYYAMQPFRKIVKAMKNAMRQSAA